jgi:purine-nucleoside phosphorylase
MDIEKLFKYCFGCSPEVFPGTVIITPVLPIKKFKEHCEEITSFSGRLYSGMTASKNGSEFAVVRCGLGDSCAGDAVLLMDVTPARRIILAGACGGLKGCSIGDLIVCENAFNGEGFTRYHTRVSDMDEIFNVGELIPAAPAYTKNLKRFLSERASDKTALKAGDIFTIGSIMAERQKNLVTIEENGFRGIDLELSAVYHAARRIDREATGLMFVSDLPLERPLWRELTRAEKNSYNNGIRGLIRLSVEFAVLGTKPKGRTKRR